MSEERYSKLRELAAAIRTTQYYNYRRTQSCALTLAVELHIIEPLPPDTDWITHAAEQFGITENDAYTLFTRARYDPPSASEHADEIEAFVADKEAPAS